MALCSGSQSEQSAPPSRSVSTPPGEGSFTRPADPCPGLELGLADVDLLGVIAADNSGAISRDVDVGVNACGLFVQAVDLVTRGPSNVASVS